MSRHNVAPFQINSPVFVRIPFQSRGRIWERGKHFKWSEMGMDEKRIRIMYNQGFLFHDNDLAENIDENTLGDGLNDLDLDSLHAIVKQINEKVKAKAKTEKEFLRSKCKISKIKDKQVGIIRSWRRTYGPKYE